MNQSRKTHNVSGACRVCRGGVSGVCRGCVGGVSGACRACRGGWSRACRGCVGGVSGACRGKCFPFLRFNVHIFFCLPKFFSQSVSFCKISARNSQECTEITKTYGLHYNLFFVCFLLKIEREHLPRRPLGPNLNFFRLAGCMPHTS